MLVTATIFHTNPRLSPHAGLLTSTGGEWGWSLRDGLDGTARHRWDRWVAEHTTTVTIGPSVRVRRWARIAGSVHRWSETGSDDVFATLDGHLDIAVDADAAQTAVASAERALAEIAAPAVELVDVGGARVWADVALAANVTVAEGDADALVICPDGTAGVDLDRGLVRFDRADRHTDGTWMLTGAGVEREHGSVDLDEIFDRMFPGGHVTARRVRARVAYSDIADALRGAARVADSWGCPIRFAEEADVAH